MHAGQRIGVGQAVERRIGQVQWPQHHAAEQHVQRDEEQREGAGQRDQEVLERRVCTSKGTETICAPTVSPSRQLKPPLPG